MFLQRSLLLLSTVLTLSVVRATEGEQNVTSRISTVKVFLNGAQIERSAKATVVAGTSTLVFTGLSQAVDANSIQVNGKGAFSVMSVKHRINYLNESPKKAEIEDLEKRIKQLEHDWAYEKAMQAVWENEEHLLDKNAAIGGQQSGLTLAQLQGINDYVRERLRAIKAGWIVQQDKLTSIGTEADKLRAQLAELNGAQAQPTSEVVVEVSATSEVAATFTIGYVVSAASWYPLYDLRVKNTAQPVQLTYKAQVTQSTGEDWDRVKLTVSSGNPRAGNVMPSLQPWWLQVYAPSYLENISTGRSEHYKTPAAAPAYDRKSDDAEKEVDATTIAPNMIVQNSTTFEYQVETPYTIPSDGQTHDVGMREEELNASYKYYASPKLDKSAFLFANITGWEDLDLLAGQANVFFEGTYVGQTVIDPGTTRDTLGVSLGRDPGIVITRVKEKAMCKKSTLGGKRSETLSWKISVRNTKAAAVELELVDQFPVSQREDVTVQLENDGSAIVDKDKGELRWRMTVEPKGTRELSFTYTVKFPKDLNIVLE